MPDALSSWLPCFDKFRPSEHQSAAATLGLAAPPAGDRIELGSKSNAAARKLAVETEAYNRYLNGYKTGALAQADADDESATVDYGMDKKPCRVAPHFTTASGDRRGFFIA